MLFYCLCFLFFKCYFCCFLVWFLLFSVSGGWVLSPKQKMHHKDTFLGYIFSHGKRPHAQKNLLFDHFFTIG